MKLNDRSAILFFALLISAAMHVCMDIGACHLHIILPREKLFCKHKQSHPQDGCSYFVYLPPISLEDSKRPIYGIISQRRASFDLTFEDKSK